jgi:hypothetical protein
VEPGEPGGPSRPRWYERVVTTTLLGVVALTLAVLLVPGLRDQLALTATRREVPRIELWFSGPTERAVLEGCRDRGAVRVEFTVRSHVDGPVTVPFRVLLMRDGQRARVRSGALDLAEGDAAVVRHRFRLGAGQPYSVRVTLPGRPERLHLRCGTARG